VGNDLFFCHAQSMDFLFETLTDFVHIISNVCRNSK
jgi:hypothetical protein